MAKFRKIGVLTSGGDAPGMNAAVKAVVNRAATLGIEVVGVMGGYAGLVNEDLVDLTPSKVFNLIGESGTALYSSRCDEFATEEGMAKAVATCKKNHIDALVCIGGDGTFRGATDICNHGIPAIGITGTIDNDITASDYTTGLDTTVNTTTEMVDNLRDTCESHARVNVVEAMGRHCGHIALYTAVASGATCVCVPEIPFDEDELLNRFVTARKLGKRGMVALIAEGCETPDGKPYSEYFTKRLKDLGFDAKFFRPAHTVRGGEPTQRDRIFATECGIKAVDLLVEGKSNLVIVEHYGKLVTEDINLALVADKLYKGKITEIPERYNAEERAHILELGARKKEITENLNRIVNEIKF